MPVWPCGTRILGLLQPYVFKLKFGFEKTSMFEKKLKRETYQSSENYMTG
jgi:hypothetical protein